MSTPSRVTRSSSRHAERSSPRSRARSPAAAATPSGSHKKKASSRAATPSGSHKKSAASSSGKKKSSGARADSEAESSSSVRARRSSGASSAKHSLHTFEHSVEETVTRVSGKARSLADDALASTRADLEHMLKASSVSLSSHSRHNSNAQANADVHEGMPLVALIPHVALYAALAAITHVLVVFAFSKESLQSSIITELSRASLGLLSASSLKAALHLAVLHDVAAWTVVPLYLAAGLLLQKGVKLVLGGGQGGRAAALASNIARVVSAALFVLTVSAYSCADQRNSYEGLNALAVLQFAFMFQEFLLNFSRFTYARQIYSLLYMALTGYLSFLAYNFDASAFTSPQAPVIIVAINYALMVVNTSDNLAAAAGACAGLGLRRVATLYQLLQAAVNFIVLPLMSIALYQRHGLLFPQESEHKQPSFLDSTVASLIMVGLVFLCIVDGYIVPVTRVQVRKTKTY